MSDTQINSLVVVLFVWCWLNPNYEGMVAEGVIGWLGEVHSRYARPLSKKSFNACLDLNPSFRSID